MAVVGNHLLWHSSHGTAQGVSIFLQPTNFYTLLIYQEEIDTTKKNIQNVFLIKFNSNVTLNGLDVQIELKKKMFSSI